MNIVTPRRHTWIRTQFSGWWVVGMSVVSVVAPLQRTSTLESIRSGPPRGVPGTYFTRILQASGIILKCALRLHPGPAIQLIP